MKENNKRNFDLIKGRLLQFAEHQGIPKMDFYEKISVPQSNFGGKSMESSLSSAKIAEILIIFPELSPDWLLLEKGEMLRKNNAKNIAVASAPQAIANNGDLKNEVSPEIMRLLNNQQDTISTLSRTIERITSNIVSNS